MVSPSTNLPVGHDDVAHVLGMLRAVLLIPGTALLPVEGSAELDPLVHRDSLEAMQWIPVLFLGSLLALLPALIALPHLFLY